MILRSDQPLTWQVAFMEAWHPAPLRLLLGSRCAHVLALAVEPGGAILYVDPAGSGLRVRSFPGTHAADVYGFVNRWASLVLLVPPHLQGTAVRKRSRSLGLYSCVGVIKALLRIEARRVLTPAQLARHLRARGATVLMER